MKFLKVLGNVVFKIVGMWAGFTPLLSGLTSTSSGATKIVGEITQLFGVIDTAEKMFAAANGPDAKTGSQKLAASVPFIAQMVQRTDLLIGKKPKDETEFAAGATDLTNALVRILNSYGE